MSEVCSHLHYRGGMYLTIEGKDMKEIIENEVYKYSLRIKECYDLTGKLIVFPSRKPMQCMVLKNFSDTLSDGISYTTSELLKLIGLYSLDVLKEIIFEGLQSYGFILKKSDDIFQRNPKYLVHYYEFLGLDY